MGTTAPVNKDSGACLLRSPFVQVKNFDDMPTASFVNEKYALIVEAKAEPLALPTVPEVDMSGE